MYLKLITLLILFSSPLYAKEEKLSNSPAWLKLLHYQKTFSGYKSKASRAQFFFSKDGQTNPESEFRESLKAFREAHKTKPAACAFPARFKFLKKHFPDLISPKECPELKTWLKGIDAGDLYIVFSSAYPSNPASLFGHTFLRFDRISHNISKATKKLLGYSLAFQAQTNSDDNSFIYTFKGITGGYQSFLEIKPHYIDVGVYNNSESRDLWEYKIELTADEKEMLLLHTWEIITTTTFPYFFFDENCSTLVLELLEAAKPEWDFKSKNDLFVVPQVTLQEIVEKTSSPSPDFRPAIKRIIAKRFSELTSKQVSKVLKAKENLAFISEIDSIDELDLLIDLWKLDNYKNIISIEKDSKERMNATLLRRSQLKGLSKEYLLIKENALRAPHKAHKFKRLALKWQDGLRLNLRYGFHNFEDPSQGYDEKSYIDFINLETLYKKKKASLSSFKLIEILSLQDFTWSYPQFSWNIRVHSETKNQGDDLPKDLFTTGGVGLSSIGATYQLYFLGNLLINNSFQDSKHFIGPLFRIGLKKSLSEKFMALLTLEAKKLGSHESLKAESRLYYNFSRNLRFNLGAQYQSLSSEVLGLGETQFYF